LEGYPPVVCSDSADGVRGFSCLLASSICAGRPVVADRSSEKSSSAHADLLLKKFVETYVLYFFPIIRKEKEKVKKEGRNV
jgi:hypothetical protein